MYVCTYVCMYVYKILKRILLLFHCKNKSQSKSEKKHGLINEKESLFDSCSLALLNERNQNTIENKLITIKN